MLNQTKLEAVKTAFTNLQFDSKDEGVSYLCSLKTTLGLTWEDIAELSAEMFGTTYKEGYFRHNYGDAVRLQ